MGDSLSVRISAATGDFNRGINSAQESLGDLRNSAATTSGFLQALAGRADAAGDNVKQLGRRADKASASMVRLGVSSGVSAAGAAGSFASLSAITTASLIPALVALGSTLFPIVTALTGIVGAAGALAGAFGAVIGTGILAFGEKRGAQNEARLKDIQARVDAAETRRDQIESRIQQLQELRREEDGLTTSEQERLESLIASRNETERTIDSLEEEAEKVEETTGIMGGLKDAMADLRAEIAPLLVQFGQQFVPLIEDAIDALPILIDDMINASEAAGGFIDPLRELGAFAMDVIPELVYQMFRVAQEALPAFLDMLDALRGMGPGMIDRILSVTRRTLDVVGDLVPAFTRLVPVVTEFGLVVLNVIVPALRRVMDFTTRVLNEVMRLGSGWQRLVAIGSLVVPVLLLIANFLGGPVVLAIGAVVAAVVGLWKAWESNFANIQDRAQQFWELIQSIMPQVKDAINAFVGGVNLERVRNALAELASVLQEELQESLTAVEPVFERFGQFLQDNREELTLFGKVAGSALVGLLEVAALIVQILGVGFREIVIPAIMLAIDIIDMLTTKIANLIKGLSAIRSGNLERAGQRLMDVALGEERAEVARTVSEQKQPGVQGMERAIEVIIEGDTGVINEEATRVVEDRERQAQRDSGRNAGVTR